MPDVTAVLKQKAPVSVTNSTSGGGVALCTIQYDCKNTYF